MFTVNAKGGRMEISKYRTRKASYYDIECIYELEKCVGNDNALSKSMLIVRIETFPVGQLVGVDPLNNIVGYAGFFRTGRYNGNATSWYDLTSYGYIHGAHRNDGDYMFGMNLTGHPECPGVGLKLHADAFHYMMQNNLRGIYFSSRVPGFSRARGKYSIEEWVYGDNYQSKDPEVRYYQKIGYKIFKVIPDFIEDEESCNYGVLMLLENPLITASLHGGDN
jgi:hypothetical protein